MTNRSCWRGVAAGVAMTVAGCGGEDATTGALGQSQTSPNCAADDSACQNDGLDAPLAIGARLPLDVHVTARGVAAPHLRLEPVQAEIVGVADGMLVGRAAGWSSVLMLDEGASGLVLDFLTLSVEAPDRLEIVRLTKDGAASPTPLPDVVQLAVGDDLDLAVKPWRGDVRLIGELDAAWTLSAADVVTLLDSGRLGSRRVRVRTPGRTVVTTSSLGLARAVTLEVLP